MIRWLAIYGTLAIGMIVIAAYLNAYLDWVNLPFLDNLSDFLFS